MSTTPTYLTLQQEFKLAGKMYEIWHSELTTSELNPFMEANSIVMTTIKDKALAAAAKKIIAEDKKISAERHTEVCNHDAAPIIHDMKEINQTLKHFYPNDFGTVREWGGDISIHGLFTYPSDFMGNYNMFKAMNTKYLTYTITPAPIEPFLLKNGWIMADMMEIMDAAKVNYDLQQSDYTDSYLATEQCETLWAASRANMYLIRNYIITLNINSPRGASRYGIIVHQAAPHEVNQLSSASPMEETLIKDLVKDSYVENLNAWTVDIKLGLSDHPKIITIEKNGKVVVGEGMSVIKLVGSNPMEVSKVLVTVKRSR
ncbi:MAG: hypothetical protein WCL14_02360 [Bacteroidota bacterium]